MVAADGTVTTETWLQTRELDGGFCVLEPPLAQRRRPVGREDRPGLPLPAGSPRVRARPRGLSDEVAGRTGRSVLRSICFFGTACFARRRASG
jgi:hypothetical protein